MVTAAVEPAPPGLRRAIRLWAGLDLLLVALLAYPGTAFWLIQWIYDLSGWLGGRAMPGPVDSLYLLFVYLTGTLGLVWAVARLRYPVRGLALLDTLARLWVAGLIGYVVVAYRAPSGLWLIAGTEILGALHQGVLLLRSASRRSDRTSPVP